MNKTEINDLAQANQQKAWDVLRESGIAEIWESAGCRVNLVGSLRMGLLASHRDIDLHVYSTDISASSSFAVAAEMSRNPKVTEIKCINGLHTDEHCMAWHGMSFIDLTRVKYGSSISYISKPERNMTGISRKWPIVLSR